MLSELNIRNKHVSEEKLIQIIGDLKYIQWLNNSISFIDGTLTGSTTPDLCGSGSNGSEEIPHVL